MSKRFRPAFIVIPVVVILILGASLMVGMGGARSPMPSGVAAYPTYQPTSVAIASDVTRNGQQPNAPGGDKNVSQQQTTQQRLVIKNAVLQVMVDKPEDSVEIVAKMADEMGGWVVTSSKSQARLRSGATATQAMITIRVPSERLTEALDRIKVGAVTVQVENINGQDVTQDYVDTVSRITNLEAAEAQLRKIMDGASRTEDVLSVYDQLVRVRGDIETAKGRIEYYKQAAAFSSIAVTLTPNDADRPLEVAGWRPLDTVKGAFGTLLNIVQFLISGLIWLLIVVLPFVIVLGVPGLLIRRAYSRRQQAQQAAESATNA